MSDFSPEMDPYAVLGIPQDSPIELIDVAYEFLGKSIIEAYADENVSEQIIEDQLYPESPGIINKFQEVVNALEPILYEGAFINKSNQDIKFRKILLPLGENGVVKHIIGGMRWKAID